MRPFNRWKVRIQGPEQCSWIARIRQASPSPGVRLCLNEGNAAVLAGDWPHALLAYRLAQRLAPNDREVNERVSAISARLLIPDRQPGQAELAAAALATNAYLRISLWLLAALLYGAGWLQIAHAVSDQFPSNIGTASIAILAAVGLAIGMFWAEGYRARQLEQQLAVIRVGETGLLREGTLATRGYRRTVRRAPKLSFWAGAALAHPRGMRA